MFQEVIPVRERLKVLLYAVLLWSTVLLLVRLYFLGIEVKRRFDPPLAIVQSDRRELVFQMPAVLLWEEVLVRSGASGPVSFPLGTEPSRVRAGGLVARVGPSSIYSPEAGIFCPFLDGLEGEVSFQEIWVLGRLPEEVAARARPRRPSEVSRGEAVGKVVLPMEVRAIGYLPSNRYTREAVRRGFLSLRAEPDQLWDRAEVFMWEDAGSVLKAALKLDLFPNDWAKRRVRTFEVLASRLEGLVVPEGAVLVREGRVGVLVVDGGVLRFRPVKVFPLGGGKALVEEGLSLGEVVVADPSYSKEGDRIAW